MLKRSPEDVARHVLLAGSDSLEYFGGVYEGGYCLQQNPAEATQLLLFLRNYRVGTGALLELGTAAGGFARLLDDFLDFRAVYVADDNTHARCDLRHRNLPHAKEYIGRVEADTFDTQLKQWDERFDVVVCDLGNDYDHTLKSLRFVLPYCNSGCIIILHNTTAKRNLRTFQLVHQLRGGNAPAGLKELSFLTHYEADVLPAGLTVFEYTGGEPAVPKPKVDTFQRNLIYHFYPHPWPEGCAQFHVDQLGKYLDVFNGRIIFHLVEGTGLLPLPKLQGQIRQVAFDAGIDPNRLEFLSSPNHRWGEVLPFFDKLLPEIGVADPNQYTFYAHAKRGSSKQCSTPNCLLWCETMYQFNLSNMNVVRANLKERVAMGAFRLRANPGADYPAWHYSGTFFWINNEKVFEDPKVLKPTRSDRCAVETWVGDYFEDTPGACVFGKTSWRSFETLSVINNRDIPPALDRLAQGARLEGLTRDSYYPRTKDSVMHETSYYELQRFLDMHLAGQENLKVLDVGSYDVNGSYKALLSHHQYTGGDIVAGPNVDKVFLGPYEWGVGSDWDVVISGQCLEHVEDTQAWACELGVALKPGGLAFVTAPACWPYHRHPVDCWRVMPDGMAWLLRYAGLEVLSAYMNDTDTVGIARKPLITEK